MKEENNCEMTKDNYTDIISYCYDVLEILEKLNAGENYIKGNVLIPN